MILTLLVVAQLSTTQPQGIQLTESVQTTQDAFYLQPSTNLQLEPKTVKSPVNSSEEPITILRLDDLCNLVYWGAIEMTGELCGLSY